MMFKKRGQEQAEFINLFGSINQSGTQLISAADINAGNGGYEEERDLNEAEAMYLKEFEQNDQELEDIAGEIVKALDTVKRNAENIEAGIDRQSNLLQKQYERSEKVSERLQDQSTQLKDVLNKHKSGRQCCFDLFLLSVWLALCTVLLKMLQSKGYLL